MIEISSCIDVKQIRAAADDWMVAAAAKVSVDPDEALQWALEEYKEDVQGLINYLMKHHHGSPFEHTSFTFFVEAPIFVFREHHRHRAGWSYNEESGRYKVLRPKVWVPRRERHMVKGEKYKAARPTYQRLQSDKIYNLMVQNTRQNFQKAYSDYLFELDWGIVPEVARRLLPVSTYSSMWATCNARSLMHFLSLRTHEPDAKFVSYPQKEIEEVARAYEGFFAAQMPMTYLAWINNGRQAP